MVCASFSEFFRGPGQSTPDILGIHFVLFASYWTMFVVVQSSTTTHIKKKQKRKAQERKERMMGICRYVLQTVQSSENVNSRCTHSFKRMTVNVGWRNESKVFHYFISIYDTPMLADRDCFFLFNILLLCVLSFSSLSLSFSSPHTIHRFRSLLCLECITIRSKQNAMANHPD